MEVRVPKKRQMTRVPLVALLGIIVVVVVWNTARARRRNVYARANITLHLENRKQERGCRLTREIRKSVQ